MGNMRVLRVIAFIVLIGLQIQLMIKEVISPEPMYIGFATLGSMILLIFAFASRP